MKLILKHSGIRAAKGLRALVQQKILILEPMRQIDLAMVRITREEEASPAFCVRAHLVTPGPDLFAEARDHTLAAALGKAMRQLTRGIKARAGKRLTRLKSNLTANRGPMGRLMASPAAR
ncbi:MAG: HPF/RaiA family ribosome-associated protein [Chthoniobacterales bacterium]